MTFSLPAKFLSLPNPDCPTSADCTAEPGLLTQPIFLMSTFGPLDQVIDSPAVARGQYDEVPGHAAMGVVLFSGNRLADHTSIQDQGGDPHTELGYATAWLEYQLRGDALATGAFSGDHPEFLVNPSWFLSPRSNSPERAPAAVWPHLGAAVIPWQAVAADRTRRRQSRTSLLDRR
jgi:hypothetical protein